MHNKIVASIKTIITDISLTDLSVSEVLIRFIYSLSEDLALKHKVYKIDKESSIWVLYENSCFDCDTFLDEYGILIGAISKEYSITVYGMNNGLESVELQAKLSLEDNKVTYLKRNISGEDFGQIQHICVKIDVKNEEIFYILYNILSHVKYDCGFVSMTKNEWMSLGLTEGKKKTQDTYYRYLCLNEEENAEACIMSLEMDQIKKLWILYLQDGVSEVEFEYIVHAYEKHMEDEYDLVCWEIALRMVLSEIGIMISYGENNFSVMKENGAKIRLDYIHGSAAEKLFLKLLFPIKITRHSN